jgi:hypothetical protein
VGETTLGRGIPRNADVGEPPNEYTCITSITYNEIQVSILFAICITVFQLKSVTSTSESYS